MSLGFEPWLLVSIDNSFGGMCFIIKASGAGGLALGWTYTARFSRFLVDLWSCWTFSLGSCGAPGGGGLWDFPRLRWCRRRHLSHVWLSLVAVGRWWIVAGGVADRWEVDGLARQAVTCERGARGIVFDEGAGWTFPLLGSVTGLLECRLCVG